MLRGEALERRSQLEPTGLGLAAPQQPQHQQGRVTWLSQAPQVTHSKAKPDVRILTLGLSGLGTSQLFERAAVLRTRLGVSIQAREEREEGGKREIMQQL